MFRKQQKYFESEAVVGKQYMFSYSLEFERRLVSVREAADAQSRPMS